MLALYLILYVLAAACFLAYTLGYGNPRLNLLGLGVLFWALIPILQTLQKL